MAAGRSWNGLPVRLASLIVTRWPLVAREIAAHDRRRGRRAAV